MIEKFKKIAAFTSAAVMMTATFLYFPSGTFKRMSLGILANALDEGELPFIPTEHTHKYENGFCTKCEAKEEAKQNTNGYYEISNAGQLYSFAEKVNNGEKSANAILTADIILNENVLKDDGTLNDGDFKEWTPIKSYNGTFDGQGHTISGLYRDSSSYQNYGLFGNLNEGSSVSNIVVTDSYIVTYSICAGGIVANNYGGTISNCFFSGFISAGKKIGGICSWNLGTIKDCYSDAKISGLDWIGGIVGINYELIENCFSNISIDISADCVGSIVGSNDASQYHTGRIRNSYFNNTIYNGKSVGKNNSNVDEDVLGKTTEQFASGEVAFLLGDAFGQTIGTDEIPVLGGQKVYNVKKYSDCGKTTEVGSVYSNSEENIAPAHDYSNSGICNVCNALENGKDGFKSASVSLTDGVIVNYNVILSDKAIEDENAYIKFTAESGINKNIKFSEAVLTGETYKFSLELRPDQMSETIIAQVIYGDGTEGNSVDFSIKEYSEKLTNEADKKLADSMKLYGAFAQVYTGRKTDNLVSDIKDYEINATIGEEYNYSLTENASGIKTKSATLQIGSKITIVVKYQLEEGKNISDYDFMCGDKSLKPVKSGDYYCVYLKNILPQDLDKMYEIVVKDKGNAGNETTLKYSAFSYMKSAFEKSDSDKKFTNLLNAMYYYNKAAEDHMKG